LTSVMAAHQKSTLMARLSSCTTTQQQPNFPISSAASRASQWA